MNARKPLAVRTAALVAVSCWLVASCASTHGHAPPTRGGDGREIEAADSLDAVENALAGASAADLESVAESIAEAHSGERAAGRPSAQPECVLRVLHGHPRQPEANA